MGRDSKIEWCNDTWNPLRGCSRVSEGCRNCYAEGVAARFGGPGQPYEGLTNKHKKWNGTIKLVPEKLDEPLRWTKPSRIFVNSMSDLFHEAVPFEFIDQVFAVMAHADQHTFQVLTKRPERMRAYLSSDRRFEWAQALMTLPGRYWPDADGAFSFVEGRPWPLPNVWLGVSVEDQATADERIPLLLQTPAAVRWISAEPLLGPVDLEADTEIGLLSYLKQHDLGGDAPTARLDWVVVGGESGTGARPMHPAWARSLRDQCVAAGVPFLFKQWGEYEPVAPVYGENDEHSERAARADEDRSVFVDLSGVQWPEFQPPDGTWCMERVGKRAAGRVLDGRMWDEYPT